MTSKGMYVIGAMGTGNLANDAMKAKVVGAAEQVLPYTPYVELYFGHSISSWAAIFSIIGVVGMIGRFAFEIWYTLKYKTGGKNDKRNKS